MDPAERDRDWSAALASGRLPQPVEQRLGDARAGRTPWVATMTPAELLLSRSHGVRPIATVSGNCWYAYGQSWTDAHAAGWAKALDRLRLEGIAAGANAVLDVKLRTVRAAEAPSMDYTLIGTAVRVEGLTPSADPLIATVPALEFVRLLEVGIVPAGIAVGAAHRWLGGGTAGSDVAVKLQSVTCKPIPVFTDFWEEIRGQALKQMRKHAAGLGNGILVGVNFGEIVTAERKGLNEGMANGRFLGRHIVIGTVVDVGARAGAVPGITPCIDLRDGTDRLGSAAAAARPAMSDLGEQQGGI